MPITTAQQVFKDLEKKSWKPFYLIVGEEPFQAGEITAHIKQFFVKDSDSDTFNFESFEGDHLDASQLLSSLEMMPGLFDAPDSLRLVQCQRFEKVNAASLEVLEEYFNHPSETTCFLMTATKADKRKAWYKKVDKQGAVVEVEEPYDREWPKWHSYFEKKCGKKIDPQAWEMLVENAGRMLSILWMEVLRASTFVGEAQVITAKDMEKLMSSGGIADIFAFAEDVVLKRRFEAMKKYERLIHSGENEIKILSILVRQFRMVDQCLQLMKKGITDTKVIAPQIGSHPFFVSKIMQQTKGHTPKSLGDTLNRLADCDFRMKRGECGLFESFLITNL